MTHELKCWPIFFQPLWDGRKTFEVRKNDRNFKEGDDLIIREFRPHAAQYRTDGELSHYTGRYIIVQVSYVLNDQQHEGVREGYCVLGFTREEMRRMNDGGSSP